MDWLNFALALVAFFASHAVPATPAVKAELKQRLNDARANSPLFDMPAFAAAFADIAGRMARRWRDGLPPAAIDG